MKFCSLKIFCIFFTFFDDFYFFHMTSKDQSDFQNCQFLKNSFFIDQMHDMQSMYKKII